MFAENAMLVSLTISQWTARKLDKKATKEVAVAHGVSASVGAYHKSVLPGSTELEHIKTCTGNARTFYYKNTLPWGIEGSRILPNKNYLEFTQEMRGIKQEWEQAVLQFVNAYPTLRADAQQRLNGLFNYADYPTDIRAKFGFDIGFMPVPQEGDFRINLHQEELDRFRSTLLNAEQEANKDLWQRLYDVVKHAADRLRDPDAIFRDSLVDNAVELCSLLPKLNFSDDPNLEAMRVEVESVLCSKAPDALRAVPDVRTQTTEGLDDILAKMGAFYAPEQ